MMKQEGRMNLSVDGPTLPSTVVVYRNLNYLAQMYEGLRLPERLYFVSP